MDQTVKHSLRLARMARMDLTPNPRERQTQPPGEASSAPTPPGSPGGRTGPPVDEAAGATAPTEQAESGPAAVNGTPVPANGTPTPANSSPNASPAGTPTPGNGSPDASSPSTSVPADGTHNTSSPSTPTPANGTPHATPTGTPTPANGVRRPAPTSAPATAGPHADSADTPTSADTPRPAPDAASPPDQPPRHQPPADEVPTEQLPVVRPPAFANVPPPEDPLGGKPEDLPGSAGEHLLQLAYDTRDRAERFYSDQMTDRLNETMIEFVRRMDMAFIATADSRGEADCSFRAGPPGFIQVLDDKHVAYPEYRGNGVLASLGNISENPHVGILLIDFVRDRIGLHINGRAMIVEDDAMRAEFPNLPVEQNRGRRAERWVLVEVDEAYIHCRKHIPAMQPVAADQAWGTDDVKRKGGDYFGVRAERRGKQTNTTSPVAACQSKVNGS